MKIQLILLACVASALAAPQLVPIVKMDQSNDGKGTFRVDYTSADGTVISQRGQIKSLGSPPRDVEVFDGGYTYTAPDGKVFKLTWVADEKGFHPTGDHLPTSPPIPPEILKSLPQSRLSV